ncbi:gp480 [Bacillus phage G]|uniref:Gp480 n=1 Tax=Bacillus phage G TaxID=2884420 RepID=G3MAM1_9CAUD|nr:gp480 [Bacillus phage G]AEO93738.1 gp480 [Bacillus phage G]
MYDKILERLKNSDAMIMLSLTGSVEFDYIDYTSGAKGIYVSCDGETFLCLTIYNPEDDYILECRNYSFAKNISTSSFDIYFEQIEEWIEEFMVNKDVRYI